MQNNPNDNSAAEQKPLISNREKSAIISALPLLMKYKEVFESANKRLSRTTLTGKISSLQHAATLFDFMETTQKNFEILQRELIDCLLTESVRNSLADAQGAADLAMDILTRSLYERSADVRFLAGDLEIVAFARRPLPENKKAIESRLREYMQNYTIYEEIAIVRTNGTILARGGNAKDGERVNDPGVLTAAHTQEFTQIYKMSEIVKKRALIFAYKIASEGEPIGILIMIYKTLDELKRVFASVDCRIAFVDESGIGVAATNSKTPSTFITERSVTKIGKEFFACRQAISRGFEDYNALKWRAVAYTPLLRKGEDMVSLAQERANEATQKEDLLNLNSAESPLARDGAKFFTKSKLEESENMLAKLPETMLKIVAKSQEISEDLGDVAINGELIASKMRAYALNPILQNIRQIGDELNSVFARAQRDLCRVFAGSLMNEAKRLSSFLLNILVRNLYERAADCRWWARRGVFYTDDLAAKVASIEELNALYTVYALIFIYDKNGVITAVSKKSAESFVGEKVGDDAFGRAIINADREAFFVTRFEPSALYGGLPTFIYHASLINDEGQSIGGIGLVFDAVKQLKAILSSASYKNKDGEVVAEAISLLLDENVVIASTSDRFKPLEPLGVDLSALSSDESGEILSGLAEIDGKKYIAALTKSAQYREYAHPFALKSLILIPS
ncbi:MAG: cache domain-containing protein [Helicobacteraceae bacterium]|jgi:hypothetical protein|nr:cache domain-containing protein [Helicobacteraceae bacterium]